MSNIRVLSRHLKKNQKLNLILALVSFSRLLPFEVVSGGLALGFVELQSIVRKSQQLQLVHQSWQGYGALTSDLTFRDLTTLSSPTLLLSDATSLLTDLRLI